MNVEACHFCPKTRANPVGIEGCPVLSTLEGGYNLSALAQSTKLHVKSLFRKNDPKLSCENAIKGPSDSSNELLGLPPLYPPILEDKDSDNQSVNLCDVREIEELSLSHDTCAKYDSDKGESVDSQINISKIDKGIDVEDEVLLFSPMKSMDESLAAMTLGKCEKFQGNETYPLSEMDHNTSIQATENDSVSNS